jgi:hypothetical protein
MHPVHGWLMRCKAGERVHRRLQSCRNAKGGDGRFYRATHPSGMQYGRRTLHTAAAGTGTLRAAPDGFVTAFLLMTVVFVISFCLSACKI